MSTTQITVIFCETSNPTKQVIDEPPTVRITGQSCPDRSTIGRSSANRDRMSTYDNTVLCTAAANFVLWQKDHNARQKRRLTKVGIDIHEYSPDCPNWGDMHMRGAIEIYVLALFTNLAVTPGVAEDLVTPVQPLPLPPPSFYVHVGAIGIFPQTNAQPEGGGLFQAANIAVRPLYTLALEAGYYLTPSVAIAFSAGVPPLVHFKATGFIATAMLGSNLGGTTRAGLAMLLIQYHFSEFGPVQPYAGIGVGYLANLGNISDGILSNVSLDQNFALVFRAGADLMLTPNWGVFVDIKKGLFSTDAQGFRVTTPIRAHFTVDPWLASVGVTFKY